MKLTLVRAVSALAVALTAGVALVVPSAVAGPVAELPGPIVWQTEQVEPGYHGLMDSLIMGE